MQAFLNLLGQRFALVVGCILILLAAYLLWLMLRRSVRTTGRVLSQDRARSSGRLLYKPVVEFYTLVGPGEAPQRFIYQPRSNSNMYRFGVGEPIPIRYRPDKPEDAKVDVWTNVYFLPLFFFIAIDLFTVLR